jgi:hypothetical protein
VDDRQRTFHVEEFSQLRAEILDGLSKAETLFVYGVLAAAVIVTWLITKFPDGLCAVEGALQSFQPIAWWLPSVTTLCIGGMGFARYWRVKEIGEYLLRVESALGHLDLGWEKHLKSQKWRLVVAAYTVSWAVLLGAAVYFGVAMTQKTASCS